MSRPGWRWYSICSMHHEKDPNCQMCATGQWVGPASRLKAWYWYRTHKNVNGRWVRK